MAAAGGGNGAKLDEGDGDVKETRVVLKVVAIVTAL